MPPRTTRFSPPELLVVLLLALATCLKTTWALNSGGSCDAMFFYIYGQELQKVSLAHFYETSLAFNHTPFIAMLVKGLFVVCQGNYALFAALFRGGSILADMAVVAGLLGLRRELGQPPVWAMAAFALSPVSIMVSGFHGNVDPVVVALLFFAVVALLRGAPLPCGLLLGAACQVKIVPLFLVPAFLFYWWARGPRPAVRFAVPFGLVLAAGFGWPLVVCPAAFLRDVFGYSSGWGTWGITWWLRLSGAASLQTVSFHGLTAAQIAIMSWLKWSMIAACLVLAWRRRQVPAREFFTTIGASFALLFALAPGVGVQYMTWFAPFLLLVSASWWAALTAGATVYLVAFYHSTSGYSFPWDVAFPKGPEYPFWSPWTNLPWLTFVALCLARGRGWFFPAGARASNPDSLAEAAPLPLAPGVLGAPAS
jgi:hypothetical protein